MKKAAQIAGHIIDPLPPLMEGRDSYASGCWPEKGNVPDRIVPLINPPGSRIARLSELQCALMSTLVALTIFAAGGLLDWLVAHRWIPRLSLMLAGAVVALIAGALVFQVLLDLRQRHRAMIDSLERIAEINHHIRNAVQVLAYHSLTDPTHSEQAVRQVHEAVERIDWVLREFLPPGRPRVSPETAKSGRGS